MKARLAVALVLAFLAAAAGVGVSFGQGDDRSNKHNATGSQQERDFAEAAGADTRAASMVPRSFARCKDGMAAGTYRCDDVDMLSHVNRNKLGLSFVNDIWGWTDPRSRDAYALIGGTEGTVFVEITKPRRPDIIGTLPTHSAEGGEFWRDIKVFRNHAYIVSEHDDHGMQVFDLRELRGVKGPPVTFEETAHYDEVGNTHNLNINTDTGFAYLVGTSTCNSGLHMVDINQPANPTFAGCFDDHGYIHDAQCVTYKGPDREYRGREICFNSNAEFVGPTIEDIENTLSIVDVTDKANPVPLARMFYGRDGYSHQGWLTANQRFFMHGDELDEVIHEDNTKTRVWDVRDLNDPEVIRSFQNTTTSIDHNIYTEFKRAYASNYTSGLRVYDTSEVAAGKLREVGFFDLYPENDDPTFEGGTWSNYPYYKGRQFVAVSSIDRGLFVLRPHSRGDS